MSLCSPVRRIMSATATTTLTSWPPSFWTGSASVLVVLTAECMVNWHNIDYLILFSCQLLVICIASSPSYASLTPSSVRWVRHSVRLQLARCRLNRKRCLNGARAFHCCLVSSSCAPPSLRLPLRGCGVRSSAAPGSCCRSVHSQCIRPSW